MTGNRLVAAFLLRNEAGEDRYLRRVLTNVREFCDHIVVVDDGSTDDTAAVCLSFGAEVNTLTGGNGVGWWGSDERSARSLLWDLAAEAAGQDGWIYFADGDHEMLPTAGIPPCSVVQQAMASEVCTAWAVPLWDLWQPDGQGMRVDGFWQAHLHPRPWFFKAQPYLGWTPKWGDRKDLHTGHAPVNFPLVCGLLPAAIAHWGYANPIHRDQKYAKYLAAKGAECSP